MNDRQKRYKLYNELQKNSEIEDILYESARFIANSIKNKKHLFLDSNNFYLCCFYLVKYGDVFIKRNTFCIVKSDNTIDEAKRLETLYTPEVFIIQTTKNKLLEYQIGTTVDYSNVGNLKQSTDTRFLPKDIIHIRGLETKLKGYHPYSRSILDVLLSPEILIDDILDEIINNIYEELVEN